MHPTQIFLANPAALRVEYRLDDARLILWWSPLAGQSTDGIPTAWFTYSGPALVRISL